MAQLSLNTSFTTVSADQTLIPGSTQVFSSYPGSIFSGDDFYILSSGLVRCCLYVLENNDADKEVQFGWQV